MNSAQKLLELLMDTFEKELLFEDPTEFHKTSSRVLYEQYELTIDIKVKKKDTRIGSFPVAFLE